MGCWLLCLIAPRNGLLLGIGPCALKAACAPWGLIPKAFLTCTPTAVGILMQVLLLGAAAEVQSDAQHPSLHRWQQLGAISRHLFLLSARDSLF